MSNYHVHERFNGIIEQSMNHILKTNEFLSIICKILCGGARYQRAILPRLKVRASKVVNNYPGGHGGNKSMLRNKMTGTMAVDNTRCMYVRMYANCTSRLRHIYIYDELHGIRRALPLYPADFRRCRYTSCITRARAFMVLQ